MSEALLEAALAAARAAGARHVEVRLVRRTRERLSFRDGALDASLHDRDVGVGVRALVGDGWGYGATSLLTPASVAEAARAATAAAAAVRGGAPVAMPSAVTGTYTTPLREDPFAVPLADKVAVFAEAHAAATSGVKGTRGEMTSLRLETELAASNGTRLSQAVTICGGGLTVLAVGDGDVQVRSHPKSTEGNVLQGGFEHFRALDLPGHAPRLRDEALALLRAEPTPAGKRTIVLDGSQLSLQIHESVGHPTELDRVLGEEISLAGASFLLPDRLGRLKYGADIVNLTADATTPTGPGTFGFDDEGTPATRTPLVENGRFVGFLSGRDSAARIGRPSGSCLRAESWSAQPIVRMINVNLEPGAGSLDDLIGGIDDGLLLSGNKSWSIDDLRLNFQFSTEIAYEIRGGRRTGRIFKNPVYHGVTPAFWQSCRAICGPEEWRMWGWMYCGKGDPIQLQYVGHGCAPARFDGVDVGASS